MSRSRDDFSIGALTIVAEILSAPVVDRPNLSLPRLTPLRALPRMPVTPVPIQSRAEAAAEKRRVEGRLVRSKMTCSGSS